MRVGGVVSGRRDLLTLDRPQASLRLTASHGLLGITGIGLFGDLLSQLPSLGLTLDRSLMNLRRLVGSRGHLITLNRPQASLRLTASHGLLGITGHRLRGLSQLLGITSIGLRGGLLSQLTSLGLTLNRSLVNLRRLTSSRTDLVTLDRPQPSLRLDIASHRLRSLS